MLYVDINNMYTEQSEKRLHKYVKNVMQIDNKFTEKLINEMCDFLIIELVQLQAIKAEPLINELQKQVYNNRVERCKHIWKTLQSDTYKARAYFKIRQDNNRIYQEWRTRK